MVNVELLSKSLSDIVVDTVCKNNIKKCVSEIRCFIENIDMGNDMYIHIPMSFESDQCRGLDILDNIRISTTGKSIEFNHGIVKTDMLATVTKM